MKETIKVLSLFCVVFLIALTPWLLLRQESQSPDDTIHREAVNLTETEATEELADQDAPPGVEEPTVEDKLRILYRAGVSSGTYSSVGINWDALDMNLLADAVQRQMEALVVYGALPQLEMGYLRGVEPVDQVTFYDPQDAAETVQIMTMYLVYENFLLYAAMDVQTNLFYAIILQEPSYLESDWLPTNLQPTAFLEYLGVEEPMEISIVNLEDSSGFYGQLTSSVDPDLVISFEITGNLICYCPGVLDYLGLMQY